MSRTLWKIFSKEKKSRPIPSNSTITGMFMYNDELECAGVRNPAILRRWGTV